MAITNSNVNLNSIVLSGNTGIIGTFPELETLRAVVFVPKNTIIPAAEMVSQSTFATYVNGKFINDTRSSRWFVVNMIDMFKDDTKKPASWDTGRLQTTVYEFPGNYEAIFLQSFGNFIELKTFSNSQGIYDWFFIDDAGNWHGTTDSTGSGGLKAYTAYQFFVENHKMKTTKEGNQYPVHFHLNDPAQNNQNFKMYQAAYAPDSIIMLQNVFFSNVTATLGTPLAITATTSAVFTVKFGQYSADFIETYLASLTKACFTAYDLTAATTLTISSITLGNIVVASQSFYYIVFVLSAAPTGDLVQFSLASPSAVNAIIPNANVVCEVWNPGTDGQNAGVNQF